MKGFLSLSSSDTCDFSLPRFSHRSLIASSFLFHKACFHLFSPSSFQGQSCLIRCSQKYPGDLACCVCPWRPRLYQNEQPAPLERADLTVNFLPLKQELSPFLPSFQSFALKPKEISSHIVGAHLVNERNRNCPQLH